MNLSNVWSVSTQSVHYHKKTKNVVCYNTTYDKENELNNDNRHNNRIK